MKIPARHSPGSLQIRILPLFALLAGLALGADPPTAELVFVTSQQPDSLKAFDFSATGDVAPEREITGPASGLTLSFSTLVDSQRREVYVADFAGDAVRIYDLDADGDMLPLREIVGAATMLESPLGMALDPNAQELFVKPYGSSTVLVFPLSASGNVAPSRVLTSSVVLGGNSRAIAVDPRRGELFVSNQQAAGAILVFPIAASGLTAPIRTLAGPTTQLVSPSFMTVDAWHDELLVVANGAILTFGRAQTGDVAPARSFSFSLEFGGPAGIDLDPVADELAVSGQSSSGHVLVFPRTTIGVSTPLRDISGPASDLSFNGALSLVSRQLFADGFEGDWEAAWSLVSP